MFQKIKQFIDTNYWYSFRKKNNIRNINILTNTWDGISTIIDYNIIKVEHMFYNIKKFSITTKNYFNANDVIKYGTFEDKRYIVNKYLLDSKQLIANVKVSKDNSKNEWFRYYLIPELIDWDEEFPIKYNIVKQIATSVKPISSKKQKYTYVLDKFGNINKVPCELYNFDYINIGYCLGTFDLTNKTIEKLNAIINKEIPDINLLDNILKYLSIEIEPLDFKFLSKELVKYRLGKNKQLHLLWVFRKLLKSVNYTFDDYLDNNDYYSKIKNGEKLDLNELTKLYRNELKIRLDNLNDFIFENYDNLYD